MLWPEEGREDWEGRKEGGGKGGRQGLVGKKAYYTDV